MIVDDDLGGERHSAIGGLIKVQLENNQKSTSGNWIHVLLLAFCALIALIHFRVKIICHLFSCSIICSYLLHHCLFLS